MKTLILVSSLLLGFAGSLEAQTPLRINEVIFGVGAADDIVELINDSGANTNTSGVNMCSDFQYAALASATVAPGGTIRVHVGVAGTNTPTDLFTGVAMSPLSSTSGNMSLYIPGSGFPFFSNPANLVDFLQWGFGGQPRSDLAAANGSWPSTGAFLATVADGQSLAWDGAGDALADWFRDGSPTDGAPNLTGTAATSDLGPGCDVGTPDRLELLGAPALGNLDLALSVETDNPSAPSVLFIGIGSINANVLQVCHFYVDQSVASLFINFNTNGSGNRLIPIPIDDPSIAGIPISVQAAVSNAVPFPKFDLTNGRLLTF